MCSKNIEKYSKNPKTQKPRLLKNPKTHPKTQKPNNPKTQSCQPWHLIHVADKNTNALQKTECKNVGKCLGYGTFNFGPHIGHKTPF
jgi:hypothetical protein